MTNKRPPASIYEAMADASAASIIESLRSPRLDLTDSESEDGLNYDEILNRYASVADQFSIIRCQALLRKYAEVMRVKKMLACIPKRNGTAREVLDTEVKYIENLEQVVEVYIKPLRADANNKGQLINKDDLKTLFSELEVILAYAKSLKSRIKERVDKWFPTQIIGDIFVQMIDFFKIYTQYCTNYPKAMETLERCKKNSSFVSFLQEREQASGVIIPIENFLIMPVQRIPRYALLVEELMRNTWETHPDYDNLKKALVRIQEVAEFVNEQKRYKENFARILEIYNSLVGIKTEAKQDMLILQKNIWFLREGNVLELMMKGSLTKFYIFLFNGMLLWTKQSKGTYEFKKMTPIDPQTKVEIRTTDEGFKMIHLTTSQGLYVFKTDSAEDAESWLNKINESKNFVTPVMERKDDKSSGSNPGSLSPSPSVARKEEMAASPSFTHHRASSIGSAASLVGSKSSPGIGRSNTPKKNRNRAGTNSLVLTGGTNRLLELKEQEEADTSVNQKIEEEAKFIKEWEALDDTPELDKFSVDANEIKAAFDDTSSDTFAQYATALRAVQAMNIPWEGPEILLIGKKGEGRTSVLEALLGQHISGSCRPLFIHLVNNPKRTTARIVLKKDTSLKSAHFFNDVEVRPEELDVEIMSRSKVFSLVPIHIHFEHKSVWNMTIIDPPGVASFNIFDEWYQFNLMSKASIKNSQGEDVSQIKDYIIDLAKKDTRLLVFVEESKEPSVMSINRIAKQLDPQMTRSIFVHTKFHYKLRDMLDFNDVNSYFNLTNVNAANTFWVSLVKRRPKNTVNEFRRKMIQTQKRDLQLLEDLQFDRKMQSHVGAVNLRNFIIRDVEKRFKEAIPAKLSQIQQMITKTYAKYEAIDHALQHINVNTVRIRANEFVNTFVSNFHKLMTGTLEMELKMGMSIRREYEEFGGWINGDNQPIIFDAKAIKRYKERLYGNPQLIRMVAVFEQIVKTLQFDSAEVEKNLAAATKTNLNQIANEIVIAKSSRHYAPLVTQLCNKMTACIKNMINAAYVTARGTIARSGNILQDTLLLSHVKNLFEDSIDQLSETAVTKCLNELKLAQVLSTHSFSIEGMKHSKATDVADLIEEVLSRIAKQFVGSVSLQAYDVFVYSGLKEATTQLTVKVASFTDEQLTQFGELNNIKLQKENEQKTVFSEIKRLQESHDALFNASQKFFEQEAGFVHSFLPEAIQSLLKHSKSSTHIKV